MYTIIVRLNLNAIFIQNFIRFYFGTIKYAVKFESYFDNIGEKDPKPILFSNMNIFFYRNSDNTKILKGYSSTIRLVLFVVYNKLIVNLGEINNSLKVHILVHQIIP